MPGRIIKGIAGFYYISTASGDVYECRAKGIFRNIKLKPLIGDYVSFDIIDDEAKVGNITDVLERKNILIRPAAANIDQAVIIFAMKEPDVNFNLLDRFLIMMSKQEIKTIICFNKTDKADNKELSIFNEIYKSSGCRLVFVSAQQNIGVDELKELLHGKTTVLAGPSGVGKSTIMNLIQPNATMETGSISEKIKRGKHTTRHTEMIYVSDKTYLLDTPGFSSLDISDTCKDDLKYYIKEFAEHEGKCQFRGCAHINEPNCSVKEAIDKGLISKIRYNNYLQIYEELKAVRKYD